MSALKSSENTSRAAKPSRSSALSPRNNQDISTSKSDGSRSGGSKLSKSKAVEKKSAVSREEQKSQADEIRRLCDLALVCFKSRSTHEASAETKPIRMKRTMSKKKRRTKKDAGGADKDGGGEVASIAAVLDRVGEAFSMAREHKIFTACSKIGRTCVLVRTLFDVHTIFVVFVCFFLANCVFMCMSPCVSV